MKYLVTGGAGFIGSAIANRLVSKGHQVYILDNLLTGFASNVPKGAEFLEHDISDRSTFNRLPDIRFDAVFHLAAQSSGEISHEEPAYDLLTNTLGTLLLLRWCRDHSVKRFLYASSMGIYGDVPDMPVSEDRCCLPLSFYGITKQASENYIRYFSSNGMQTTVFRMFNVYGPGQNLSNMKQGMVSIYVAYVLRGEPIVVKGPRDRFRDFIYIDDVVEGWLQSLDAHQTSGKTYNLATGTRTKVHDLIESLLRAFGQEHEAYPIQYADGTPGDQFGIYADVSRLQRDLGWQPRVALDEGLRRMVQWARHIASGPVFP